MWDERARGYEAGVPYVGRSDDDIGEELLQSEAREEEARDRVKGLDPESARGRLAQREVESLRAQANELRVELALRKSRAGMEQAKEHSIRRRAEFEARERWQAHQVEHAATITQLELDVAHKRAEPWELQRAKDQASAPMPESLLKQVEDEVRAKVEAEWIYG